MATIYTYGYMVTQLTDHNVIISKNGKEIYYCKYSKNLSGEELEKLAFSALVR